MSRRGGLRRAPDHPRWVEELAERCAIRAAATQEQLGLNHVRAIDDEIKAAAAAHGMEPWALTHLVAEIWMAGRVGSALVFN